MLDLTSIALIAGFVYVSGGIITAARVLPYDRPVHFIGAVLAVWIALTWPFILVTYFLGQRYENTL